MNAYSITVFHCLYNYIHDFFVLQLTIMSTAELLSTLISQLTAGQRPQQLAEGAKRTPSKQLQTSARNVIRDERKEKATPAQQMFGIGIYILDGVLSRYQTFGRENVYNLQLRACIEFKIICFLC